jgi:beta-lactam-binding protein with PASTA domain
MALRILRFIARLITRRLLIFLAWVIGLFVLFNYFLLPAYVNHGSTLKVPSVLGMTLDEASRALSKADLTAVQADTRADPKAPEGTVIGQNPVAGSVVKHGRRVYLTLSGGEILVTVPPLRGRSTRDAKFTLERYGLKLGSVDYATSDLYPENTIIDQTVPAGKKVSRASSVGIIVSRGKVVLESVVPDVTGRSLNEAQRLLSLKNLTVGNITYQTSYDLLPNTVVDQYPRGGESVQEGQAVDLFVVKAGKPKEEVQVPRN